MEVLILQVFVSLLLVVSSIVLWAFTHRQRDLEHADRLALLPIAEDASTRTNETKETHP